MKVYELIGEVIAREGTEVAFTVLGDGNMHFMLAAVGHGVRLVHCRHENGAAAMADGYARVSGKLGVCSVTQGPGLTTAATSILTASRRGSPLVVLTGDVPPGEVSRSQYLDQARFAEAVGARPFALTRPGAVLEELRLAFSAARDGGAPVILNIPTDLQEMEMPEPVTVKPVGPRAPARFAPETDELAEATAVLAQAERPVILAGRGATSDGARVAILALAERMQACVTTTAPAKGLFDGHPRNLGIAGGTQQSREILGSADVVLAFGASLNRYTLKQGRLFPQATIVQVDARPYVARHMAARPARFVQADAELAARALHAAVPAVDGRDWPQLAKAYPTYVPPVPPGDPGIDPTALVKLINELTPKDRRFVIGAGHFQWFVIPGLTRRPPSSYVFTNDFGAVGQAFPMGLGAAVGDPSRPVVAVEGDHAALMYLQELDTAVRHRIPLLLIVMNDEGLGAEYHRLLKSQLRPEESLIKTPDIAGMARAMGARGFEAHTLDDVRAAIAAHDPSGVPTVVDARVARALAELYERLMNPGRA